MHSGMLLPKIGNKSKLNYTKMINIDYNSVNSPYRPVSGPGYLTMRGSMKYKLGRYDILAENVNEIQTPKDTIPVDHFAKKDRNIEKEFNCRIAQGNHNHKFSFEFDETLKPMTSRGQGDEKISILMNTKIQDLLVERSKVLKERRKSCQTLHNYNKEKVLLPTVEDSDSK